MARRFMSFCQDYSSHFIARGRNSTGHARHYLTGLLGRQRRKNIETFCNEVEDSDYQGIEQFVSSSPWDDRALRDQLATDAGETIGGAGSCLLVDESCFSKKGDASVGVQRQWNGRAGKVDNCQIGVFACLANGRRVCPIDFRLYLPKSWADSPALCRKAGVPEGERTCRAKWELGIEMIRRARENGVGFDWVGADSLYGNNSRFTDALDEMGERFVADMHGNTRLWASRPTLEEIGGKRPRTRIAANNRARHIAVRELSAEGFGDGSRPVSVRQGAKGKLRVRFFAREVWSYTSGAKEAKRRMLLVRQDTDGAMKYTLTNFSKETPWEHLAGAQAQRYWIEHSFGEAKSQLGMAQYQVRKWRGWHHHMALVCLAMLFAQKEKDLTRETMPLLSTRDITELLDIYLPRKRRDEAEVLKQIEERHRQRQRDIDRRRDKTVGLSKKKKRKPTKQKTKSN